MQQEEPEFKKSWKIRTVVIVGIILVTLWMIQRVTVSVGSSMEKNELQMLDTVASKITKTMKNSFAQQWEQLEYIEKNLAAWPYQTSDDIIAYLAFEKDVLGLTHTHNRLLLIDDEGFYHSIQKGRVALWHSVNTVFDFESNDNEERNVSMNALSEMDGELDEYLCFTKKMEKPLKASDGVCFTHIVLAADKTVFEVDLSMANFGKITDALVVDSFGRKVNSQKTNTKLADSYNLLKALEETEFKRGYSYEKIEQAFASRKNGNAILDYQGDKYYLAYHYMGIEDWYSVYLVNENDMRSDISPLAYRLIRTLFFGFVIVILLIIILLVSSSRESVEWEHLVQERLRKAAEVAEQANSAKSVFLSRMSHDIRTPINGIIGMTKIAGANIEDPDAVESCLRKITSSSEHLLELVNEVLEISRIESGKTEVKPAPVNLLDIMEKLGDIIEGRLVEKNLVYETDFTGLLHPHIIADENLIKQILLNLLGNSVKYTPESGKIRCKIYEKELTGEQKAEYHFVVEDTGIGMKPEFLEHIFERFAQESVDARTNYEGTGLGMAITKEFVELMDGKIYVESKVGKGSRFEVVLTFPVREADADDPKENKEEEQQESEKQSFCILAAEDNSINRTIIEFLLTEQGHTCITVENGKELAERFEKSHPGEFDAVITDILMPVTDGLEASKMIRSMERDDAKTIPIIAMSANAYEEDKEKAFLAGINAYLTKPLDAEKLEETLQKYCRKKGENYE